VNNIDKKIAKILQSGREFFPPFVRQIDDVDLTGSAPLH
jgi:hypothetical protein